MKRSVIADGKQLDYILVRAPRRDVLLKALPGGETRVYAPSGARLRDVDALVRARAA